MPKEPPHRHNGGPMSDEMRLKFWNHMRALEVLDEQKADIALDIKVRKELVKTDGLDVNIVEAVRKRRKLGEGECRTADQMIAIYEEALRDQGALPLEQTRDRTPVRRTTDEIAQELHGEPMPELDGETVKDAAAALEKLARGAGVTMTLEAGGHAVRFGDGAHETPFEELLVGARRIVVAEQKASTSWLQRQMRVGYNTAAKIIERLQADGVVSAPDETGKRVVLLTSLPETTCTCGGIEGDDPKWCAACIDRMRADGAGSGELKVRRLPETAPVAAPETPAAANALFD